MPAPTEPTPAPPTPEEELLDAGQEEVFSRAEVELGRIEHATEAGGGAKPRRPPDNDAG